MGITDRIAEFINEMIEEAEGVAELSRRDIASRFNCVPSQINYVIATRFSPENGFIVQSRRGGGGYIRISKVRPVGNNAVMHTVNAIGDTLDGASARIIILNMVNSGVMVKETARLFLAAVSDNTCGMVEQPLRDRLRARIFKAMLINLI